MNTADRRGEMGRIRKQAADDDNSSQQKVKAAQCKIADGNVEIWSKRVSNFIRTCEGPKDANS